MISKTIILSLSMLTSAYLRANDNISYNYGDIDYGISGSSINRLQVFKFDSSFSIKDKYYLVTNIDRELSNGNIFNTRNTLSLSLGFHVDITRKTDFYAEMGYKHSRVSINIIDANTQNSETLKLTENGFITAIGTRTKFNNKFELITNIRYANINNAAIDSTGNSIFDNDGTNYGVTGLYKFNSNNSIKFGLDTFDGFLVGWRFKW